MLVQKKGNMSIRYAQKKRKGLVYTSITYIAKAITTLFSLDKGVFWQIISFFTDEAGIPLETKSIYTINDKKVSKSKYYKALNDFLEESFSVSNSDSALTSEGVESAENYSL